MNRFTTVSAMLLVVALAAVPAAAETGAEVCARMVEAHGGMEAWNGAHSIRFTDRMTPAGGSGAPSSQVVVEAGSRRATIDYPDMDMSLAWDGEKAWSTNWKMPMPPRFLALLNFYFVCLPWLTQDPGVQLGAPGTATLWDDPKEYTTVRMTFGEGVGDTPDDYYLLYIDPETHRLAGCEYIVTYAALLGPDMEHTPPKTLLFESWDTVDGLLVPTAYTIYHADHEPYFSCEIRDWSFDQPFDESRMTMPEGAVVDTTSPTR